MYFQEGQTVSDMETIFLYTKSFSWSKQNPSIQNLRCEYILMAKMRQKVFLTSNSWYVAFFICKIFNVKQVTHLHDEWWPTLISHSLRMCLRPNDRRKKIFRLYKKRKHLLKNKTLLSTSNIIRVGHSIHIQILISNCAMLFRSILKNKKLLKSFKSL